MPKPRVAILASGGGTTTESFINSTLNGEISAEVPIVISNNSQAGVFEKVKKINESNIQNIQTVHIGGANYPIEPGETLNRGEQTRAEEAAILKVLEDNKIDLVFLLGYMKRVGGSIVQRYGWNKSLKSVFDCSMLNTHPGLLPATKGLFGIKVQEKVLATKQPTAGHCIFAVDDKYDDGPVITKHEVQILPNDTPESLSDRVKQSEKKHLAKDIDYFIKKKYEE